MVVIGLGQVTVASAAVPKAVHFVVGQEYLDSKDADVPLYSDQVCGCMACERPCIAELVRACSDSDTCVVALCGLDLQCQGLSRFNVFLTTHDQPKKDAGLAPTEAERLVLFEAIKAQVQDSKVRLLSWSVN